MNSQFSRQDAQLLVALAERAPLQNMGHAAEVAQLIQRFQAWYPTTQPKPEAKKK